MPCVTGMCNAPIVAIERRFVEKKVQILVQRGLIALGKEHIVSLCHCDPETKRLLGMQAVSTHDTSFDALRGKYLVDPAQLVFFVSHNLLGKHNPRLCFVQTYLMHL